ncbi:hypothetical protein NPIL_32701 [Nephila pilipes]|uniref:Uncharacterized protein n=1 Tax=Nephila pilipes TaxID=299642 RepID=A0A8X6N9P0_NEPPI|nr:hypothetical protein NPIL_32701 [Nephila pilipes]
MYAYLPPSHIYRCLFFAVYIFVQNPYLRMNKDNTLIQSSTNPNIQWINSGLSFQQLYLLASALRRLMLKWSYPDSMVNRITRVHWSRHLILLDSLCLFYLHVTTAPCTD